MESKRQKQVGELVKRNFGLILQQEGSYVYGADVLVTVTNVKMSPDLGVAKIYISVFNTENKQEPLLLLHEETLNLRTKLGQRIKKQVRVIPEISFFLDDTLDEMYRIDAMMTRLEADGQMGSSDDDDE
jgi:ribosome-binding factor A